MKNSKAEFRVVYVEKIKKNIRIKMKFNLKIQTSLDFAKMEMNVGYLIVDQEKVEGFFFFFFKPGRCAKRQFHGIIIEIINNTRKK